MVCSPLIQMPSPLLGRVPAAMGLLLPPGRSATVNHKSSGSNHGSKHCVLASDRGPNMPSDMTSDLPLTIPAIVERGRRPRSARPRDSSTATSASPSPRWPTQADRAARALVASGVEPGDRVAIWAPNSADWVDRRARHLPGRRRGRHHQHPVQGQPRRPTCCAPPRPASCSPSPTSSTPTTSRLLRERDDMPERARRSSPWPGPTGPARPSWDDLLARGDDVDPGGRPRPGPTPSATDDLSDIIFTSGTTGAPKGAMLEPRRLGPGLRRLGRRRRAPRGRPLPDRQPVLPHVRAEGRHPRLPHHAAPRSSPTRCSTCPR